MLKVLYLDKERNKKDKKCTYWICECQCENKTIKSIGYSDLVRGRIVSCGCYRKSKNRYIDLSGQLFGRFKAIERDFTKTKSTYWICECNCKNKTIKSVSYSDLVRGNVTSCGCYQKEMLSQIRKKYNTYNLSGEYGIGYTEKGREFYFDLEDYDKIKDYCWYVKKSGEVVSKDNNGYYIKMHRLIRGVSNRRILVDHINHIKYNNKKINLRIVNDCRSTQNRNFTKNKSGHVGVSKKYNKWTATIGFNKKTIYLGLFNSFEEAVKAREDAEEKYFGEYSYKNSMERNIK